MKRLTLLRSSSVVRGALWAVCALALGATASGRPDCPNTAADQAGGWQQTPHTVNCPDGTPCGHTRNYTPPYNNNCVSAADYCCVVQMQWPYYRVYTCQGDTCVGGSPVQQGSQVPVYVTVACLSSGECAEPDTFPYPP